MLCVLLALAGCRHGDPAGVIVVREGVDERFEVTLVNRCAEDLVVNVGRHEGDPEPTTVALAAHSRVTRTAEAGEHLWIEHGDVVLSATVAGSPGDAAVVEIAEGCRAIGTRAGRTSTRTVPPHPTSPH